MIEAIKELKILSIWDELCKWQKELNRVTTLDEDPFNDPVELQDVIDAAQRVKKTPDRNWH